MRTFVGDVRRAGFGDRTLVDTEVVARNRCVQLGRIVDGAFGWGDAAPVRCRPTDARPEAVALCETLVDAPTDGETAPIATVAWGLAADAQTDRVALGGLSDQDRSVRLDGARGAFVAPAGAEVRAHEVTARFDGGEAVRLGRLPESGGWRGTPDLRRGTSRLEVRAPDPSGGPVLGAMTAARTAHGASPSPAQVVGRAHRVGESRPGHLRRSESAQLLLPGRPPHTAAAHRCLHGLRRRLRRDQWHSTAVRPRRPAHAPRDLTISGLTHPDVRLVTIATERSVRTLAPSPSAGAFVAVFDGDFPAALIELVATMADGSTVTQSLETGF